MKKQALIHLILCAAIALTGCASGNQEATLATVIAAETAPAAAPEKVTTQTEEAVFSDRDLDASYSEAECIPIALNGNEILCDSSAVEISGATATIQKAGTYLLSGTLEDGSIVIDADKTDKIQLVLNDVSIHSETSAAIYVRQADKVFVTLAGETENSLSNGGSFTPDGDTNVDAVIFSRDDLTLNGSGALTVASPGGHGIVSKDSLKITGGTYAMDVSAHGLCGKDEVSIAGGSFDLISGKDGIHAENSEDASAGTVYLENGIYQITAGGDGISASGSCRILDGEYTITTGGGSESVQQRTSNQSFDKGQRGGDRSTDTGMTQRAGTFPEKAMGGKGGMGGSRMPAQPGITAEAETDTESTKGIKAAQLTMEGGRFTVDSSDDALHSDGELTIRDGTLEIASGDDGIHAEETVTILAGSIRITESYEGIEGQHVKICGGEITLTAADDGLNAAGGMDGSGFGRRGDTFAQSGDTPSIVIAGGTVHITASGDGIDANGTLEITGGNVTVCGPAQGDTSILDYDLAGTISGGTFIGTGSSAMSQTFSDRKQGVISVNVGNQSAGAEVILKDSSGNILLSYTPELNCAFVLLSAPEIQTGASYSVSVGGTTQAVTAK